MKNKVNMIEAWQSCPQERKENIKNNIKFIAKKIIKNPIKSLKILFR